MIDNSKPSNPVIQSITSEEHIGSVYKFVDKVSSLPVTGISGITYKVTGSDAEYKFDPVTGTYSTNYVSMRISSGVVSGFVDPVSGAEVKIVDYPYWPIQVVCATNATTTANGSAAGAGDVLGKVDYVVNTTGATATLSVQDGTGTTYPISPTGGFTTSGPGSVNLGYTAISGAWKVICGSGLTAVASLL